MGAIRLVTRADDAGLNGTANRAIRSAAKDGIVRNISLMAPAPEIEDAAEVLLPLADKVDFGLHVTLTSEWESPRWGPVTEATAVGSVLRRDNTFHVAVSDLSESSPNLDELMTEVAAQYERLAGLGFTLRYLDEHMFVGDVPGLSERLLAFAEEKKLVCDRSLREGGTLAFLPGWDGPGEHPGTELADHLAGVAAGTYLLVGHPGTKDDEMQRLHPPGQRPGRVATLRNRERRMFMDIEIVDYCENVAISLTRYSAL
jgi:hypothetical protein